jgi:NADPH:quinone reductase-like Zn-dependent oxidoreductase
MPTSAKPLGPNEVLVKVHYAALNPVDHKLPELPIVGRLAIRKPAIPGLDFSGMVVQTGSGSNLGVGQTVFGKVEPKQPFGTLAEYVIGSYEGTVAVPEGVGMEDAACVGVCGLVTYQCLKYRVKVGDKVFINGGSGGTGTFAIQIAKAMGCYVTTTCSEPNVELCRSLGADEVIDYKSQGLISVLKASGKRYDMILDNIGYPPELYWECPHFTKPEAEYIQIGTQVSLPFVWDLACRFLLPAWMGGAQRGFAFGMTKTCREDYEQLAKWMGEGIVRSVVDERFGWQDVPRGFEKLRSGRVRGKLVVKIVE